MKKETAVCDAHRRFSLQLHADCLRRPPPDLGGKSYGEGLKGGSPNELSAAAPLAVLQLQRAGRCPTRPPLLARGIWRIKRVPRRPASQACIGKRA
jgi:hypothetical protein